MKFNKLRAVVSGGASGLGLATCERVVEAGGRVIMVDVNRDAGQAAQKKLGEGAVFVAADVTSEEQIDAVAARAVENFGGIDLVVNCAGVIGNARVMGRQGTMPLEVFARTVSINLVGSFNLIRGCVSHMQNNTPNEDGERGVIVNTASIAAFEGQIGQAAYSASKGGVVGMTLPIARELAGLGIRVVSIAPGLFQTPMVDGLPEEIQRSLADSIPFPKRLGKPSEYAELVQTIVQSPMLNGEVIRLDGAIRMQPK